MKTFLSIESGPGLGLATAERFAKEAFEIVLSARNTDKTEVLAEQLRAKGHRVTVRKVYASDPRSIASLAKTEKQFGAIDVLHYNAASLRKATILEQPRDTFNADLAINVGALSWPRRL
jgi:NAD(P)-dependent dehydrogenase (short-subunit alcohol dehydrogenase family)